MNYSSDKLIVHIDSGHFNAGVIIDSVNIVNKAAPVVHYMQGWTLEEVLAYCNRKNWRTTISTVSNI